VSESEGCEAGCANNNTKSGHNESCNSSHRSKSRKSRKGEGRNGFDDYPNSPTRVVHPPYNAGDKCPECQLGKLYNGESRKSIQFTGNSPLMVNRLERKTLRCNKCGVEYIAAEAHQKWTESARSAIILQKAYGMPYYRLSQFQAVHSVPIAISTLWQQCEAVWSECALMIFAQLSEEAAENSTFYVDDSGAKILEVIKDNKQKLIEQGSAVSINSAKENKSGDKIRACHTTVICSESNDNKKIILYYTKNSYSGENIVPVLQAKHQKQESHYIKIMSDASNMNIPHVSVDILQKLIMANCLTHGMRRFVEIEKEYPVECGYFLKEIRAIYAVEREYKNSDARIKLRRHKKHSSIHIKNIYSKIHYLFNKKLVEPNSSLGSAMKYWLNNKAGLTRFLKVKGIELDNNQSERALKRIILQRKNSLFFKTLNSAEIASGLQSIVSTCVINKVNPFEYLNWIQVNSGKIQKGSKDYMPWDFVAYMNNTELIATAA